MSKAQQLITEHIDIWTSAIVAKSGVGRGSRKKRELYGIKKLRELILELAVRGKLVSQDSTDEPASVLLERIAVEKATLVKEGKIKKAKPLLEITNDEKPFDLPQGWEFTRLGKISEVSPRNTGVEDDTEVSFIPMPLISTAYNGIHESEIRNWGEIKKGYTHFADGDIAIAKITPCFENSKAAIFSNLKNGIGTGTTELHVARPIGNNLALKFILLYLKSPKFLEEGEFKMTGSAGQKRVPKSYFESNPLPIPPLAEQHRIVAKVDELMLLCDQLEQQTEDSIDAHATLVEVLLSTLTNSADADELSQNWARVAEHFDTLFTTEQSIEALKQTILQLAVMGKLVPQNSDDEPASVLLDKITAEKAILVKEKKIKKQKALSPINDADKVFELPINWSWTQIGLLGNASDSSIVDGPFGSSINTKNDYIDSGVPVTRMSNISPLRYKRENLKYVSSEKFSTLLRHNIISGDVLLGKVGSIGNAVIYPSDMQEGLIATTGVARFRVGQVISSEYLCYLLNALGPKLRSIASEAVQPFLNMRVINSQVIALPPLEEQHRIVAKVDELFEICDQLKDKLQQSQQTQVHLTDALVESALA